MRADSSSSALGTAAGVSGRPSPSPRRPTTTTGAANDSWCRGTCGVALSGRHVCGRTCGRSDCTPRRGRIFSTRLGARSSPALAGRWDRTAPERPEVDWAQGRVVPFAPWQIRSWELTLPASSSVLHCLLCVCVCVRCEDRATKPNQTFFFLPSKMVPEAPVNHMPMEETRTVCCVCIYGTKYYSLFRSDSLSASLAADQIRSDQVGSTSELRSCRYREQNHASEHVIII